MLVSGGNSMKKQLFMNRKLKWYILSVLVCVFLLISGFTKSNTNNSKDALLFLGNENLPPMVYMDKGKAKGIVVDIVDALEKKIGQPIEIKLMNWSEAQKIVEAGGADALIQINENEERKAIFDFSETLIDSKFSIFTLRGGRKISGTEDLEGMCVGVEGKGFPRFILENYPSVQLSYIPSVFEGFQMLREGKLDAVVVDEWVGTYILANNKIDNIYIVGEPIAQLQSAIAVKKGNTELLDLINKSLRDMKEDGTYQDIMNKWKPKEVVFLTKEQIWQQQLYIWLYALIIFAIVISGGIILLTHQLFKSRKIEKALSEEQRRLSDIISGTNAGTWEWNIQTGEFIVNERWGQILGYNIEEISPISADCWKKSMHAEDYTKAEELLQKNFNQELDYYELECRLKHKDGSWIWVVERGHVAERDSKGNPLLMSGMRQDVTDRKKSEMAIIQAKKEQKQQILLKVSSLPIWRMKLGHR
jgi:PAS domain S-box-containing protein